MLGKEELLKSSVFSSCFCFSICRWYYLMECYINEKLIEKTYRRQLKLIHNLPVLIKPQADDIIWRHVIVEDQ